MARTEKKRIARVSKTATTVAPVGGMNTRDPLQQMGPQYAVSVQNWIATPSGLQVREGFTKDVTGINGYVETLMVYNGTTGSQSRMFACAGSRIYDATNTSASPTVVQTGLVSALWSYTNFSTPGGHYMVACNGVDTARFYDGTTWANFSLVTTPAAVGQIASSSMSNLNNWKQVIVHQRRIWITHPNSTIAHYLDVNSIGGAAVAFDFGATFTKGGSIANISTLSADLGLGVAQYLVVTSTAGEIVIYEGKNPSDAATWAMSGSWPAAEPVGMNCTLPWSGDLLMLSQEGLNQLSTQNQSMQIVNAGALTLTIQPTITSLVKSFSTLQGFQLITYPGKNLLILNVPQIDREASFQFVYNTITSGWTQFTGWPAQCWAYFNGNMYFGANGYVGHAFNGYKDNAAANGSGGDSYIAYVQQAFDYFEKPGQNKMYKMARANLSTAVAVPQVYVNCNTDYNLKPPSATMSVPPNSGNVWDSAQWDISTWGYGGQNYHSWQTINGIGFCAGLVMAISVNDYTIWTSTDWVYEEGGFIT